MKDVWKTFKLGLYVFALPLIATAAASAHQWITNNEPVSDISVPTSIVSESSVARISAIRNHTVTLNDKGEIQGRIATIHPESTEAFGMSNMSVYFVRNGDVVEKVETNTDGSFVTKSVGEGVYSFIAAGQSGFSTFGVNVVQSVGDSHNYMEVAAISPNLKAVQEVIAKNLPETIVEEVTADLENVKSLQPAGFAGTNRVQLTESGLMNGRVVSLIKNNLEGMYAHLLQGETKVAEVPVGPNGDFSVSDLKPGTYDLIAIGQDGIAAVSIEAVAYTEETEGATYTALQGSGSSAPIGGSFGAPAFSQDIVYDSADVALSQPVDFGAIGGACDSCGGGIVDQGFVDNSIVYDSQPIEYSSSPIEYAGESVCGAVACGASCGGCGDFSGFTSSGCCGGSRGFGGFGGLLGGGGRRLGLLGIIAGIAIPIAIGGDDDDFSSPNDT